MPQNAHRVKAPKRGPKRHPYRCHAGPGRHPVWHSCSKRHPACTQNGLGTRTNAKRTLNGLQNRSQNTTENPQSSIMGGGGVPPVGAFNNEFQVEVREKPAHSSPSNGSQRRGTAVPNTAAHTLHSSTNRAQVCTEAQQYQPCATLHSCTAVPTRLHSSTNCAQLCRLHQSKRLTLHGCNLLRLPSIGGHTSSNQFESREFGVLGHGSCHCNALARYTRQP